MYERVFLCLVRDFLCAVLVQDKSNGRVITVVNNRSRMAAERMMGDNKKGTSAFASLLGGSKGGGN